MRLRIVEGPTPSSIYAATPEIHHDVCGKDNGLPCGREPDHDGHCAPRGGRKKDR